MLVAQLVAAVGLAGISALVAAITGPAAVVAAAWLGRQKLDKIETAVNGHQQELIERVALLEEVLSFVRDPDEPGGPS